MDKQNKTKIIIENDMKKPKKQLIVKNSTYTVLKKGGTKVQYIVHLADIHIRKDERHKEYSQVFSNLFAQLKALNLKENNTVIAVLGDIIHQVELLGNTVNLLKEFFIGLSNIAPVVAIIGNHDMNMSSKDLDSISPVIGKAFSTKNPVHMLLNDSVYEYSNIQFGVTTVSTSVVTPCEQKKGITNIAMYHGTISGCMDEQGYTFKNHDSESGGYLKYTDFKQYYHFTLLGDIHRYQTLDKEKTVCYAGSLIQQKRNENLHSGFVLLDLNKKKSVFYPVKNNYGMIEVIINEDGTSNIDFKQNYPKNLDIKIICKHKDKDKIQKIYDKLEKKKINITKKIDIMDYSSFGMNLNIKVGGKEKNILDIQDKSSICSTLVEYIKENKKINSLQEVRISSKINDLLKTTEYSNKTECKSIQLEQLEFDNVLIYGENNKINFSKFKGIMGIFAQNNSGKSSFIDAILIGIYGKCTRGDVKYNILHNKSKFYKTKIVLNVNNVQYCITRHSVLNGNSNEVEKKLHEKVLFYKNGKNITSRRVPLTNTSIESLICTYDELLLTSIVNNEGQSFISMKTDDKRKLLCKITNIDIYETILAQFKRECSNNVKNINSKLNKKIDQYKQYGTSIEPILKCIDTKIKATEIELENYNTNVSSKTKIKAKLSNDLATLEYKIYEIEKDEVFKMTIKSASIDKVKNELDAVNKTLNLKQNKIKDMGNTIKELKDALKEYKNITKINTKFNNDKKNKITALNKQINKLNRGITPVQDNINIDKLTKEKQSLLSQKTILMNKDLSLNKSRNEVKTSINILSKEKKNSDKIVKEYDNYLLNKAVSENLSLIIKASNDKLIPLNNSLDEFNSYEYDKNCTFCLKNSLTIQKQYIESSIKTLNDTIETKTEELKTIDILIKNDKIVEKYNKLIETRNKNVNSEQKLENINLQIETNTHKLNSYQQKIDEIIKNLEITDTINRNNEIENEIVDLENNIIKIDETYCKEYVEYIKIKENYDNNNEELIELKAIVDNLIKKASEISDRYDKISKNMELYDVHMKLVEEHSLLKKERMALNDKINLINVALVKNESYIDSNRKVYTKLSMDKIQVLELKTDKTEVDNDMDDYNIVINSLQNNGIIDNLLDTKVLPQLESIINGILINIGYSSIKLKQYSKKIYITGEDAISKTMDGRNGLHVMNIIFRVGLAQLNNYIKPNFFIVDEAFDSCDSTSGLDKMKKLLELINSYYKWTLVISHNTNIKASYNTLIDITKVEGKEKEKHIQLL